MQPSTQPQRPSAPPSHPAALSFEQAAGERLLGRYDFEGGGSVRVVLSGEMETDEALDMVETLIALKRAELARRKRLDSSATKTTGTSLQIASSEGHRRDGRCA